MGRSGRSSSSSGRSSSSRSSGSRGFSGEMNSSTRSTRSARPTAGNSNNNNSNTIKNLGRMASNSGMGGYRGSSFEGGMFSGGTYGRRRTSMGSMPTIILLIVMVAMVAIPIVLQSSSGKVKNTVVREALPMSISQETEYYTDELGWIKRSSKLEKGMKEFYKKTGVQPHLYIVDSVSGDSSPDNDIVEAFMTTEYDRLFKDEAHLILLFLDNGKDYGYWMLRGSQTKSVIDNEAQDIIYDYLDSYVTRDMDDEEMFSEVFSKSATSIMTVYKSPWIKVSIIALISIFILTVIYLLLKHYNRKREQEIEQDRQTIDILNTPLEYMKDNNSPTENLKDRYR